MNTLNVLPMTNAPKPSDLARKLITGREFGELYRGVMDLVESAANYLDGQGRIDSKRLDRNAALAYSKYSLDLTTTCMRSASVCLVLRASTEGKMVLEEAIKDMMKQRPLMKTRAPVEPSVPEGLADLLKRDAELQQRLISFVDSLVARDVPETISNPVHHSLASLRLAFGNGL